MEVAEARAVAENRAKRARTGGAERVALHRGSEWDRSAWHPWVSSANVNVLSNVLCPLLLFYTRTRGTAPPPWPRGWFAPSSFFAFVLRLAPSRVGRYVSVS